MTCFGCNKPGHMLKECPEMCNLERQNKVKLDGMGKWVLSSGMNVLQQHGEAIAKAVQRVMDEQPKNGSVGLCKVEDSNSSKYKSLPESNFDKAQLHAMVGRVRNGWWIESSSKLRMLNGKRTKKTMRDVQNTANWKPIAINGPEGPFKVGPPKRKPPIVEIVSKRPVKIDRGRRFKGVNNDEIMEDLKNLAQESDKDKRSKSAKRTKRTECLDPPSKMLQQLLDVRFEVQVGDVLEAPKKNLVRELANVFKPIRNTKKVDDELEDEACVHYVGPGLVAGGLQKRLLISIALYHNQQAISRIVDTGLQVSAMSCSCWEKHMRDVPFEQDPGGTLVDANGGQIKVVSSVVEASKWSLPSILLKAQVTSSW
jgi:hypothetical protein